MNIMSKNDYTKLGKRKSVHTTIREDLMDEFSILSVKLNQPMTKMFDVIIMQLLEDDKLLNNFANKVRLYR